MVIGAVQMSKDSFVWSNDLNNWKAADGDRPKLNHGQRR